jgi:hypothetical protein
VIDHAIFNRASLRRAVSRKLAIIGIRGQLGALDETRLARLTGARR